MHDKATETSAGTHRADSYDMRSISGWCAACTHRGPLEKPVGDHQERQGAEHDAKIDQSIVQVDEQVAPATDIVLTCVHVRVRARHAWRGCAYARILQWHARPHHG